VGGQFRKVLIAQVEYDVIEHLFALGKRSDFTTPENGLQSS